MHSNMHNKANPRIRHQTPLKPWKFVRGQYQTITVYRVQSGQDGVGRLPSRPDRGRYYTTTSPLKILELAKLLADSPPVPRSKCKKLHASIPNSRRGEGAADGRVIKQGT